MHKHLLSSLFIISYLLISCYAEAQEITDTRRKTESFKRLSPPEVRTEVASFAFAGISESAQAPELIKYSPTTISPDSMIIEAEGVFAKVVLQPFDPKAHKIIYDMDDKTPIRIDRKTYYGNYGKMPLTSVKSITLIVRGDTLEVPEAAYSDLKNINFSYSDKGVQRTGNGVFINKDGSRVYLYLFSKEDRSGYEVAFVFQNGKYLRRVLDYDLL